MADHDGGRGCPHKRKRISNGAGLPNDNYWTGTTNSGNSGNAWIVDGNNNPGNVNVNSNDKGNSNRVVCVP